MATKAIDEPSTYTFEFSSRLWEEVEALASGLFEINEDLTLPRRKWLALGQMALGKAQKMQEGYYGADDDETDIEQWTQDLQAIANTIFDFFKPGDGKI